MSTTITRVIEIPDGSTLTASDYTSFLETAFALFQRYHQYLGDCENINCLELAHLFPPAPESILAIYVGINDAVCNKALVTPFLIRHGHNNVFAFDPEVYSGNSDVPAGTLDAKKILNGFEPPNSTWPDNWTYVMIADPAKSHLDLWQEKGYIDMIPAKFEDFTMLSDTDKTNVCFYIDPEAFKHPVNAGRDYLTAARKRGDAMVDEFVVPPALRGETGGLVPVVLNRGEKLYVARSDFGPCAHAWSNLHEANTELAVVNENSAVPLDLVIAKPPVDSRFAASLVPPKGSADMTTDWFKRGMGVHRQPVLAGMIQG